MPADRALPLGLVASRLSTLPGFSRPLRGDSYGFFTFFVEKKQKSKEFDGTDFTFSEKTKKLHRVRGNRFFVEKRRTACEAKK